MKLLTKLKVLVALTAVTVVAPALLMGSTALPGTAAGTAARMFSAVADSSHTPLLRGGWDNDLDEAGVHVIDQA